MPTGKTCGNCVCFIRVPLWGGSRNGLCDLFDYNCKTDSSYAKKCKGYSAKPYNRLAVKKESKNLIQIYL
jgi:hypothetical protein